VRGAALTEPGWYYEDVALPTRVSLCPASCRALEASPDASVSALAGNAREADV
jgi:hypothetical protein